MMNSFEKQATLKQRSPAYDAGVAQFSARFGRAFTIRADQQDPPAE